MCLLHRKKFIYESSFNRVFQTTNSGGLYLLVMILIRLDFPFRCSLFACEPDRIRSVP